MSTPNLAETTILTDGNVQCIYNVTADEAQGSPASQSFGPCTATATPTTTAINSGSSNAGVTNPPSVGNPTSSPSPAINSVPTPVSNTTSMNTPTPTTPPSTSNRGLAGGAVAGVAIGMLFAGVLIAGLIFFFLLRRQQKRDTRSTYTHQSPSYTERKTVPDKGATVVTAAIGNIDDLLPQPVEDETITSDLSKIRDSIKNHVRTFCHAGSISAADINEVGIQDIAALTNLSATGLINALSDPVRRVNALRAILAAVILTRTTGDRSPNLLPSNLSALSTSIASQHSNNPAHLVLVSKWKAITGALLQPQNGKQSQDPGRVQSFQDAVTSLDAVMAPFVNDGSQRRKNLDMILTRAANFAFLLFAQPGSFRFDFASNQDGMTVFPALVQTVGDQGQPLSPVKVLSGNEEVVA